MSEIYMRCLDFHEATDASYIRGLYTHASSYNTISEDGCIIDLYIKQFIVVSCLVAEIRYEGERYDFFLSNFFFFFFFHRRSCK